MSETIGFIGLGQLGLPLATNLLNAGYVLRVYNRMASKAEALVAQGAKTNETISIAPNNKSHACGLDPVTLAWTAPLPKMSTGM